MQLNASGEESTIENLKRGLRGLGYGKRKAEEEAASLKRQLEAALLEIQTLKGMTAAG